MSIAQPALEQPADSERLSTKPPRVPRPQQWKGLDEAAVISLAGLADLAADMRPASLPARTHRSEREMATDMGLLERMSHKQVEQFRRQKAKEYFEELRELLPNNTDHRCDRNKILQEAITYVRELKGMKGGTSQDDEDGTNEDMQFEMEDVAESEGGAKPSHNEVEQRRRLLAKQYFDELRSLLPNAAKFDKNTVLVNTILLIKNLTGEKSAPSSPGLLDQSPADITEAANALMCHSEGDYRKRGSYMSDLTVGSWDKKRRMLPEDEEVGEVNWTPRSSLADETAAFDALSLLSGTCCLACSPSPPWILTPC
mmetsp:Transcript_61773/g.147721  ORF Transcript_61773/g.147721 Transcript_61773/m.147721 type:complete len:313 (-) Transcript_61773:1327-2265(-)